MSYKVAAVATIVGAVAIAGAYTLGQQQGKTPAPAAVAGAHPANGGQEQREGRVGVNPNDKFTHFRVGNKNVKRIYADQGVIWVATSGGVIRYDTRTDEYKMYDNQTGLLSNGMFYVGRIQGKITVGTYGGGMSMLDEKTGTWETFNIPDGLGDAFVYDVVETRSGDIWIATWSGVNRVRGGKLKDPSAWELHTVESTGGGLPNDWVYGLAEGKNGEMWLATEGGISRYLDGKWEHWNHLHGGVGADYDIVKKDIAYKSDPAKESLHHAQQKREMGLEGVDQAYNPNYMISLVVDEDGSLWAGTWGGGLGHFDGQKWTNYTTVDGLPGNHVFMLHRDSQNRLWIGTNNGLALKEGDHFRIMKAADGLFNDTVFSMTTTKEGDLWIGSYGGVAHIRPNS